MIRRGDGEPRVSPLVTLTVVRWAAAVAGVLLVGFGAGACVRGEWGQGLLPLVVGIVLLSLPLKRRRVLASLQAAQQWSPQRVSETLAAAGAGNAPRVEQVRALRRADPRLGLADAVGLVQRGAPVDGAER
ncbi:hypothetical protein OG218_13825 [Kineococcus sp. NBC_00420]|uniref:hypothetical protein n=1 Tax=unclassified Kineococcus TaxID=2621656 RepID=UPI002E23C4E3